MKYTFFILLLGLSSCVLNANQEKSLNQAQRDYTESYNEGDVLKYVGFTHPNVVAHYKQQGDSVLSEKFDLSKGYRIQNGTIKNTVKKQNSIQVLIEFEKYLIDDYTDAFDRLTTVVVSEDSGETWFFVHKEDYLNDKIIPKDHRLIELE